MQSQELAGNHAGSEACELGESKLQFDQQVRRSTRPSVRLISNRHGCTAQRLHFFKQIAFRVVTLLRKKKDQQRGWSYHRLRIMPELKRVKDLRGRDRHLHYFKSVLARQSIERSLPQTNIICECVGCYKVANPVGQVLERWLRQRGHR